VCRTSQTGRAPPWRRPCGCGGGAKHDPGRRANAVRTTSAPLLVVPRLVGHRQEDAHQIVARAGFKLRWTGFTGKLGNGRYKVSCVKVLSQSPVAGERRPRGASISVIEAACRTPTGKPYMMFNEEPKRWSRRRVASDERTANLLGALALTLADRAGAAVHAGAGVSGSDAAALVILRNYAEGEPLHLLRRALALSQPGVVRLADRLQARGPVERHRGERRALGGMLERMLGAQTTDATASLVICRMCDPDVCGHPDRCRWPRRPSPWRSVVRLQPAAS
jgi:hypothetical protein